MSTHNSFGWRLTQLYPFLFAVLPILHMASGNIGKYRIEDLVVVLGSFLAACGIVYALVAVALRMTGQGRMRLAPLIVLVPVLAFFNYRMFSRWFPGQFGHLVSISIGLLVIGTILAWLAKRPHYLDKLNTFLTLCSTILVVHSLGKIIAGELHARRTIERSGLVKQLARPIRSRDSTNTASVPRKPDIYLIVLDQHANSSVLRHIYGFDNRAFEDSLRRLGFTIPPVVWSNYARTTLSLPSLLNAAHLVPVAAELGPNETNVALADYLVENNRAVSYLHQQGYRFVFFPSQWWPATRRNRHADSTFRAWRGLSLDHAVASSNLSRKLRPMTLLGSTSLGSDRADADFLRRTLAGIKTLAGSSRPIFAFAHLMSPHTPWVFDQACRTISGPRIRPPPYRYQDRRQAYVEQVQCIDSLVLDVVHHLVKHSAVPPVILLQGDHGSNLLEYERATSAERVSPAQAWERFGAFGAYYLPEGGAKLFADTTTVVNVLRHVLVYYAGADLPLEPDDLYMSLEQRPFALFRVDPHSLAPPVR